jgi:hypothetical protein
VAVGLTLDTVGSAAVTIKAVAVAVTDVSATEVAVMNTVLGVGTVVGALYTPMHTRRPFGCVLQGLETIVPIPVRVVESAQVTSSQVGVEVRLQPGLFTVALNEKVSPVPTVAEGLAMLMLIPVTIVSVAVAVLDVSAFAVPVIVTVGAIVVVPLDVVVGMVAGAV